MKSLSEELNEKLIEVAQAIPEVTLDGIQSHLLLTQSLGMEKQSLNVGDSIPMFFLTNALGSLVYIQNVLERGPVVISFYRGAWCPFCNIELHMLQKYLPVFKEKGAQLIAISPQIPDHSLSLVEKLELSFEVLSDLGNQVAKQFGIVFRQEDAYNSLQKEAFHLDLKDYNGDATYEIPIPATYVVNQNGKIEYAYIDSNFTHRAEPKVILEVLSALNGYAA